MIDKPFYRGVRWKCIAHYGKLSDQTVHYFTTEEGRNTFVQLHNERGANVSVYRCKWYYEENSWSFHSTK